MIAPLAPAIGPPHEMQARTYHESQGKPTYYIRELLDTQIDEPVAVAPDPPS